ncbi:helix-turn-helix domain-containing protein [Cytobacillus sp. FJAT-53684]|uniref:Helix-turn-helix domain-containing protein n=1 Tax=Cytobacillus mangrovibacter TaxID=3299024 RepID=A0ABW6K479_9BACI
MSLPEVLKKQREDRNWSQDFVANLLNVHRSTISKYETGQITPSYQTLIQFATIYKLDMAQLVGELVETRTDKQPYILKESPNESEMDLIRELLENSSELKRALLDLYNFDIKKKSSAIAIFHAQIQAMKKN